MELKPIVGNANFTNNVHFKARYNDYVAKKTLSQNKTAIYNAKSYALKNVFNAMDVITIPKIAEVLKSHSITNCSVSNDKLINIAAGYNGGFYSVSVPIKLENDDVKKFVACDILLNQFSLGGLKNYIAMVKDLKRQDIIQKGLKVHTYELNNTVLKDKAPLLANKLSKSLNKDINATELFCIEDEVFYYDKEEKTAYGMSINVKQSNIKPLIRVCKYSTDSKNNAIGYKIKDWDVFQIKYIDTEYQEQQAPYEKLPAIADSINNKNFAEAFRFGNSTIHDSYRTKIGIPVVLNHLSEKLGVNAGKDDLQIVRFYDKSKDVQTRICYYDATIGRSFVYSPDGKYLYQLEYNKDHNGNIVACTKY